MWNVTSNRRAELTWIYIHSKLFKPHESILTDQQRTKSHLLLLLKNTIGTFYYQNCEVWLPTGEPF